MTGLRVEPLTEELWPGFEDLMADSGGPAARCWCMYWRRSPERPIMRLVLS